MTLGIGNHVVKLDSEGKPLTFEREGYIEFEVVGYTSTFNGGEGTPPSARATFDEPQFMRAPLDEGDDYFKGGEVYQFALLRKVQ